MGYEHYIPIDGDPHAVAIATGVNTARAGRTPQVRLRSCRRQWPQEATVVYEGQHHEGADRHLLETVQQMYKDEYAGKFEFNDVIIDACAMKLVMNPGSSTCW